MVPVTEIIPLTRHLHRLRRVPGIRRKWKGKEIRWIQRTVVSNTVDDPFGRIRRGNIDCHIIRRRTLQTDGEKTLNPILIGVPRDRWDVVAPFTGQVQVLHRNIRRIHITELQVRRLIILTQDDRVVLISVWKIVGLTRHRHRLSRTPVTPRKGQSRRITADRRRIDVADPPFSGIRRTQRDRHIVIARWTVSRVGFWGETNREGCRLTVLIRIPCDLTHIKRPLVG